MTATNHALTGALIGLAVHNPWVALPVAVLSHLICDIVPHFSSSDANWLKKRSFTQYLLADAFLCIVLVAALVAVRPEHWLLASFCAFLATSPDMVWVRQLLTARSGKTYHPTAVEKFLGWIQWFQRPVGAYVELAWFVGSAVLLWQFL